MKKQLIQEAFRLQTLAGITPINEIGKDYDSDGKIESPEDEYLGSKDKAIKASKGVKECAECEEEEMGIKDFVRGEDHEGYMAHSELKSLQSNASRLMNIIGDDNAELPGWVSTYISLAADYMNSVTDYLSAKEPEQEEEYNY